MQSFLTSTQLMQVVLTAYYFWQKPTLNSDCKNKILTITFSVFLFLDCLNFDLNAAGAMSALPYIAVTIVLQSSGHLSDYLSSKKTFTITQLRKIFVGVGFMGQCLFLIISVHWLSKFGTIFCLIVAVGFGGFAMSAFW